MLTRRQRSLRIAEAEIRDTDRYLALLTEDRERHRLCGPVCERWTKDTAAIHELLAHRLVVQDWRDTEVMCDRSNEDQGMAQAT